MHAVCLCFDADGITVNIGHIAFLIFDASIDDRSAGGVDDNGIRITVPLFPFAQLAGGKRLIADHIGNRSDAASFITGMDADFIAIDPDRIDLYRRCRGL